MVDVAALIVTSLGTLWGVFTYFQLRREQGRHDEDRREFERELERERQRHAELVFDLQQRNAASRDISGLLREIQHCVDDHGGEPAYQARLDEAVRNARAFVLTKSALLGEDVVTAVQTETSLSAEVFRQRREHVAEDQSARRLADARSSRVRLLDGLSRREDLLPANGTPDGGP